MDQNHYDHLLSDAVMNIDYDQVKYLTTLHPVWAKKYAKTCISDITTYRGTAVYHKKGEIIIDMCKILFDNVKKLKDDNNKLLKWAVDTTNIILVKYIISAYKKFNKPLSIVELFNFNDDCDEFYELTDEILHYLVKRHKEYGVMKISEYYYCWDKIPVNRLANIGFKPINNILI